MLRIAQKHNHEIHLCVAIVKYRTKLKIPRKGVCTSYLSVLKPGRSSSATFVLFQPTYTCFRRHPSNWPQTWYDKASGQNGYTCHLRRSWDWSCAHEGCR